MTVADSLKSEARTIPWWLLLLEGIAVLILGILLLAAPGKALTALVGVIGLYLLVRGILMIVGIFVDRTQWVAKLIGGIVGIIAGILVIQHPLWTGGWIPVTITLLVGISAIVAGVVGLAQAVQGGSWGYGLLGAVGILIGFTMMFNIGENSLLPVVLGILAIAAGIFAIVQAVRWRPR